MRNGLVQVYTGAGKGKTTAAVGLAIRSLAAGFSVAFLQFFKKDESAELKILRTLAPRCRVINFCQRHPLFENCKAAQRVVFQHKVEGDLDRATKIVCSGRYDLVVLDEVLIGLRDGFYPVGSILNLIHLRPPAVELVLTGRGAPPEIIDAADLVTRMEAVKHPFFQGVKARRGIEY